MYIAIDNYIQDATVRKLFREVRKQLNATTAIRLYSRERLMTMTQCRYTVLVCCCKRNEMNDMEIIKSDEKMEDVGITDRKQLRIHIHHSDPEIFTIFVTLFSNKRIPVKLEEVIWLCAVHAYIHTYAFLFAVKNFCC